MTSDPRFAYARLRMRKDPQAVIVPLLDLKQQYQSIKDRVLAVTNDIYESQSFILGPRVEAFERAVADYVGARFAIGMSSGTDAQLAAMMSLGIGPGDDVVTSPYTFFSSAGAVYRLGARAVFCDIDPVTFNVDPAKLAEAITPRTKAIQPIHLFGQCADMDPILGVARQKGIPVIEDACQSLGAEYKGKKAGNLGDFGCFSFFPSKNLGGFGDGGMVTVNSEDLAQRVRSLRTHGQTAQYFHKYVGGNFRLDALQAAILNVKLPHLDNWGEGRRKNAAEIEGLFSEFGGVGFGEGGIGFPRQTEAFHHVFNQFVIRVAGGRRDELKRRLGERQIGNAIYYPVPLHLQECFALWGGKPGDFPEAERAAGETLAIPVFPELTAGQKEYVAFTLAQFSRGE